MRIIKSPKLNPIVLIVLFVLVSLSCKENSKNSMAANSNNSGDFAVEVKLEGELFKIKQENLQPTIKKVFHKDSIFLEFWEDGNPIKLNLNLTNTTVLESGSASFKIPEDNSPRIKVDLNFFNSDRDTKSMNKRIIFRKGTIEIIELTSNRLVMRFDGEGSGITERNNFPISGKVNVAY